MLTAVSAPPGSGKSLWCVELLEKTVRENPNRQIFTNIIGINIQGVLPIVSSANKPFDWRDLPDGSLVIYDEAHEHPAFSKNDLLKNYQLSPYLNSLFDNEVTKILDYDKLPTPLKKDLLDKHSFVYSELPLSLKVKEQEQLIQRVRALQKLALDRAKEDILDIGRSLTMHRHWGFDIVLVTQKPDLLNSYVKAATSTHLILRRLFKMELAVIYEFTEIQDHFGNATRKNAISWKLWFFPKRLYKYYISAEVHTAKASLPWTFKIPIFVFLLLVGFSIYRAFFADFQLFKTTNANETKAAAQQQVTPAQSIKESNQTTLNKDLTALCRKAVNVDTPECVKFFDDLTKNGGSLQSNFVYDASKPYDVEYKPIDLEPNDFPRFKNAIVYNGKCTAYSQQGTIMHSVSKEDCYRLANGDRPFDYFSEQQTAQNTMQQPVQQPQKMTPDEYAKYLQYLNDNNQANNQNYVSSSL